MTSGYRLGARFAAGLKAIPNPLKILIAVAVDALVLVLCVLFAYVLRISEFDAPPTPSLPRYMLGPLLSICTLAALDVYRNSFRTFTPAVEVRVLASQLLVAPIWAFLLMFLGVQDFARSVTVIYVVLAMLALDLLRRLAAWFLGGSWADTGPRERVPAVIIGAGPEGVALAAALERQRNYNLKAFLDTDYTLVGRRVAGKHVHALEQLETVVAGLGA